MRRLGYISLLLLTFATGMALSWSSFGQQIDNYAYDFLFRLHQPPPWKPESIILAADEESFASLGGLLKVREALAAGLMRIAPVHPRAVAIDFILSEAQSPEGDLALEQAFGQTQNLILACDLISNGERWDEPLDRFRRHAAAIGHIQADLDPLDAISREIPLEKATARERRWALSLEAFRLSTGSAIVESPEEVRVGNVVIPSSRASGRSVRIRYAPVSMGGLPRISLKQLADRPELAERFRGKVVFAGVTAQTAVRDRWMTPLSGSVSMPGIEIHANAFETFAHGLFLRSTPLTVVLLVSAVVVLTAGLIFGLLEGWAANGAATLLLLLVHALPYAAFTRSVVFPFMPAVACGWLSVIAAAAWQHVVVRHRLRHSESARTQYREAMQFVTHEMKTPLTAIQGSSELMGRYALPEEKQKQMAATINSESKRLAQMIETFLNAERLSAGQMELKRERCEPAELLKRCVDRIRVIAERKEIGLHLQTLPAVTVEGDRELLEFAFYNLLSNAVKYSASGTEVTIAGAMEGSRVWVAVQDQGVGIAPKDAKRVFEKFYRTRDAERSNEKGTGIGLSIVDQIVRQHGGTVTLRSELGRGSTFTVSLPMAAAQAGSVVTKPRAVRQGKDS